MCVYIVLMTLSWQARAEQAQDESSEYSEGSSREDTDSDSDSESESESNSDSDGDSDGPRGRSSRKRGGKRKEDLEAAKYGHTVSRGVAASDQARLLPQYIGENMVTAWVSNPGERERERGIDYFYVPSTCLCLEAH